MASRMRAAYDQALSDGAIRPDPAQAGAVDALCRLEADLAANRRRWLGRPRGARGIYLWGPVGRGKSMFMDMFFEIAPVKSKQRTHFHVFMARIHRLANLWRTGEPAQRRAQFGRGAGRHLQPGAG